MKRRFTTGLVGALACALWLTGCAKEASNASEDEEEQTTGGNSFSNPIVDELEVMRIYNCSHHQATVFYKASYEANEDAKKHTFAAGPSNPQGCPTSGQSYEEIFFDNGTLYQVWAVRVENDCHQGGDQELEVDTADECPRAFVFEITGQTGAEPRQVEVTDT